MTMSDDNAKLVERLKESGRRRLEDAAYYEAVPTMLRAERARNDAKLMADTITALSRSHAGQEPAFTRYYMRDNHTFKKLSPDNSIAVDEIRAEFDAGHTGGMVCGKYSDNKDRGEGQAHANSDWHEFSFRAAKWLNDHPSIPAPQPIETGADEARFELLLDAVSMRAQVAAGGEYGKDNTKEQQDHVDARSALRQFYLQSRAAPKSAIDAETREALEVAMAHISASDVLSIEAQDKYLSVIERLTGNADG